MASSGNLSLLPSACEDKDQQQRRETMTNLGHERRFSNAGDRSACPPKAVAVAEIPISHSGQFRKSMSAKCLELNNQLLGSSSPRRLLQFSGLFSIPSLRLVADSDYLESRHRAVKSFELQFTHGAARY
jgi:hypothetical protein